eukprot:999389_1
MAKRILFLSIACFLIYTQTVTSQATTRPPSSDLTMEPTLPSSQPSATPTTPSQPPTNMSSSSPVKTQFPSKKPTLNPTPVPNSITSNSNIYSLSKSI